MPAHPRTAFIHIGPHKTGTTALQNALDAARDKLVQAGYHYLEGSENHSTILARAFWNEEDARKIGNLQWLDDPEELRRYRQLGRDDIREQIERSAPRHLILSGEELSLFHDDEVLDLVSFLRDHFDEIRVIAYAREIQGWLNSDAQERLKWVGGTLDETFRAPRALRYNRRFSAFLNAVGGEHFDLRIYGNGAGYFNILQDFSTAVGLPAEILVMPPGRVAANQTMTHRTATVLSQVNAQYPPFVEYRYNPCRAFKVVRDDLLPGRKFMLPRETIEALSDTLKEERAWLTDFFGREVFTPPKLPKVALEGWYEGERGALEDFALLYLDMCRRTQNEQALKAYSKARNLCDTDPASTHEELSRAILLTTDRWTLHHIAVKAVEIGHTDRQKALTKQRLMRRIEAPQAEDPPLIFGNPFDRK